MGRKYAYVRGGVTVASEGGMAQRAEGCGPAPQALGGPFKEPSAPRGMVIVVANRIPIAEGWEED